MYQQGMLKEPIGRAFENVEKLPRLEASISDLVNEITNLSENLYNLENRLRNVLGTNSIGANTAESKGENPMPSLYSGRIESQTDRLKQLNYLVADIRDRLEV